ncbi:hypothetical protein Caci_7317 [Catenulispora acidiphila DSM 44928]|uniref:Uncharacterized protein n=2 Tax=Catenulispora TaxID=414878 RepID=C7Q8F8_CATAD|nr:hypothetical protein Caci_7317 [Catenulispora acidiphila DSM 44928]
MNVSPHWRTGFWTRARPVVAATAHVGRAFTLWPCNSSERRLPSPHAHSSQPDTKAWRDLGAPGGTMSLRVKRLLLAIMTIIAVLLIAYVCVDGQRFLGLRHTAAYRWSALGLFVIDAASASMLAAKIHRDSNPDNSPGPPVTAAEDPIDILRKTAQLKQRHDDDVIEIFTSILTHPELCIARAVEDASVQESALELNVRVTFDLRQASGSVGRRNLGPCIVPFMRMQKGALLDNLEVRGADGANLATLSQHETRAMTAIVVTNLFWKAYIDPKEIGVVADSSAFQQNVLALLLRIVFDAEHVARGLMDSVDTVLGRHAVRDEVARETLLKLVRFLASHYVIAAAVPEATDDRAIIEYTKNLPCYAQYEQLRDKLRLLSGLRPYRFTVPLWLPYYATSYHFRMRGTGGQYVANHYLTRPTSDNKAIKQDDFETLHPRPYIRLRHNRGLPYGHLYMRDFRSAPPESLATVVRFAETPPGALGGAALVSWASAALAVVFTFLTASSGTQASSDIPALLLASPAFAASFLGYTTDSESLLRTSLTARFGLTLTGVISFSSAVLFLLRANQHMTARWTFTFFGGHLHLNKVSPYWLVLAVASTTLAIYLTCITAIRTRRYMKAVAKFDSIADLYGLD